MRLAQTIVIRILVTTLTFFLSLFIASGQKAAPVQTVNLANPTLNIGLDAANGRLVKLIDTQIGLDFIGMAAPTNALWRIDLLPGCVPNMITPAMAGKFRWEYPQPYGRELKMVWEDFGLPSPNPLQVEVRVTLANHDPLSAWSIRIQMPDPLRIEKVHFPRVPGITRQPEERLAVPLWMGQLTESPRQLLASTNNTAHRFDWSYPGALSLQCVALYRENGPGLYFSCDDTAAFPKTFAFWGDTTGQIGYEMIHYPEIDLRPQPSNYSPSYHALIGTFRGDWITAAERYRHWGTNQVWAVRSRLNRGLVPDWLLKTSLWVWNRGRSEGVVGPTLDLAKELQLPVSIFWHWWHGCPYDTGFPDYLPPREGTEHFKFALDQAHKSNVNAIVYMNQRLWGMTTRSWKRLGAARYAVEALDGKVKPEIYNTYTEQPCAAMCLATPFWRGIYASIATTAVRNLGVDGIYMDQACSSLLCYDPEHGHPPGGGTYWINGYGLLAADLRARTRPLKNLLLAGEGVGEAWLPYLDLMLALQVSRERYATTNDGWTCIPFFHAVYHPYGVIYGNYSSLTIPPYDELWPAEFAPKVPLQLLDRKFATQFYLEQARTFAWGNQPTIANYLPSQRQERGEEIQYLLKLARVRAQGVKYLLYGTFLRPPAITNSPVGFAISHLSIYAGRKGKAEAAKKTPPSKTNEVAGPAKIEAPVEATSPPLICGAWNAKDGSVGIALANITSAPQPFQMDARQYGFRAGDRVSLIEENGRNELGPIEANGKVALEVGPRDAVILEFNHPRNDLP
jgi:hypothetical protein